MAKFQGSIGYMEIQETAPGVSVEVITERKYKGDILRSNQRWENNGNLIDDFIVSNTFSVIVDPYFESNIQNIRYILWRGQKWKVKSIEIKRPRVNITLGDVYNA